METKLCIKCKGEIPQLRLKALPNTFTCVECSTVGAKKSKTVMYGQKDDTWTDIIIVDDGGDDFIESRNLDEEE
jgi:hypothetical protein